MSSNAYAGTAPLPGDPRVCGTSHPASECLIAAAVQAARKHVGGPGGLYQGETACKRASRYTLTFSCQLGTRLEIVRFTKNKAKARWVTTVTP